MTKKERNIQDTVFEIIKYTRESGQPSIRKADLMNEMKKTPFEKYDHEKYNERETVTKLDRMVGQALSHLKKSKRIKKRGKGWTLDKKSKNYKPVICNHLIEKEDGRFYCPIKKVYIGDPTRQCELIHGTNYSKLVKSVDPMCPGYTNRKSTPVSQEFSKKLIDIQNKKRDDAFEKAIAKRGK